MPTAPILSDPSSAPPSAELLATVAHELRTPLATLHATLEVLGDLSTLPPEDAARFLYRLQCLASRGFAGRWRLDLPVESPATGTIDPGPAQRPSMGLPSFLVVASASKPWAIASSRAWVTVSARPR